MKAISRISSIILLVTFQTVSAFAQSDADRIMVLQECVNLFELQNYIIGDHPELESPVFVVRSLVPFPDEAELTSFGKRVVFVTASEMNEMQIDAYFQFSSLEISGNSGSVSYSYFFGYDSGDSSFRKLEIVSLFQKSPNGWYLSEKTFKEGVR